MRGGGVDGAALGGQVPEDVVQQGRGLVRPAAPVQHVGQLHGDLAAVQGGTPGRQHAEGLAQLLLRALQLPVLGVDVAAHPVAVGEFRADLQAAVQLGRLGQRGVGLGETALGDQGAGDRAVHAGDQGGVAGLRGESQGELGGLGGASVRAHVHVRADGAGVEQQQGVRVVQAAAVEFVEGGLQQVDGVSEFTGEIVGDGPAAQGRDPGGQRRTGQARLGPLEELPPRHQLARLQGALAEPEQRGGLLRGQAVRLGLAEQPGVLLRRLLGLADGEGALRLGQPQPQLGDAPRRVPAGEFVEGDAEPLGEMPQGVVGGPHPAGLQGGDVGGRVHGLRQLPLCQSSFDTQPLHPAADGPRIVTLPHANSPCPSCRSPWTAPRLNGVLSRSVGHA